MPVSSLSDVTSSLATLFKENIELRLSNSVTIATSSVSPLDVAPGSHLINLFLFHFHPDGKQSIHENPSIAPPYPASFSKPLTLYYHVTAHHNSTSDAHLVEQDLLGHALASIMDHTELGDGLSIDGTQILDTDLRDDGNDFELEVLTKSDTEALGVWAAHEGAAIRPSLFFKVKNVRLRPLSPISFSEPILSIGHMVIPTMGPRITSLRSTITATVPLQSGPVNRQFRRSPAELFLGAGAADRRLTVAGSSIDQFALVDLIVPVGTGTETIRIDFDANEALGWAIHPTEGGIAIDWVSTIQRLMSGVPTVLALEPGAAQLRLCTTEYMDRDGLRIPVEMLSNPVALTLHPHIGSITPMAPRQFRINLDGAYDLVAMAHPADHASMVRLAVGGLVYEVMDQIPGLADGQCAISGTRSVDFILHTAADDTQIAFVQLWIRNVVSQPFWIGA